jgi:uncharacterized membrane protein
MATGLLLVLGAELFYIQDVFRSRLNTVFKLYYQAWILLAISGAGAIWWLADRWQLAVARRAPYVHRAWRAVAAVVLVAALLYPAGATLSRTDGLSKEGRTLDGLAFARQSEADDFAAIQWLRDRAGPGERIIEASGAQYGPSGRVAAWTGIPTVLGWAGHESQWGRDRNVLELRKSDVDTVYETESLNEALRILQQYGVTYVFVGSVERAAYPPAGLQKFADGLPLATSFDQTAIYRVPRTPPDSRTVTAH